MPPVTPRTRRTGLLFESGRRFFHGRRQLPLHLIPLDLFHGHARRLGMLRLGLRRGALHELLGALGNQQHVAELAVNALGQSFHLVPPGSARPSDGWIRARSWSVVFWR